MARTMIAAVLRTAFLAGVAVVAWLAAQQGIQLRQEVFAAGSRTIDAGDVDLAFRRGASVMRLARQQSNQQVPNGREFWAGYLSLYPHLAANGNDQELDYPPLRLLVVSLWARHVQVLWAGPVPESLPNHACILPLLDMNSACGALAAIGMFFLVWLCMARQDQGDRAGAVDHEAGPSNRGVHGQWSAMRTLPKWLWWACGPLAGAAIWLLASDALQQQEWPGGFVLAAMGVLFIILVSSTRSWPAPFRYWGCGLIAALLFWFNAALIIDGYGWVQWDVWLLPAFVWAALLAALDWWLAAGILIAVGGMLKGQMFLVAPLFILWPLLEGKFFAAVRWLAGMALACAVVVGPWLLDTQAAKVWTLCLAATATGLSAAFFVRRLWPNSSLSTQFCRAGAWLCLALGSSVFLAGYLGHGDWSWYDIGFAFGAQHHNQVLTLGYVANVPGLLESLHWYRDIHAPVGPWHIPWTHWQFTCEIRTLLAGIYALGLVLCAAGCAVHHRRRDARLLIALLGPWILFPLLLPQMSARYWMWCAALSAGLVGVSLGASLLSWILTAAASILVLNRMTFHQGWRSPMIQSIELFVGRFYPDLVWPLMLMALICLWLAVVPRRRIGGKLS